MHLKSSSESWKKLAWSGDTYIKAEFLKFDCEYELEHDADEFHVLNVVLERLCCCLAASLNEFTSESVRGKTSEPFRVAVMLNRLEVGTGEADARDCQNMMMFMQEQLLKIDHIQNP
ncbi:hypothetical protein QVD17_19321 [Tagetes erecta]|uniref:Uncharacterized protein n=1 Tax=Tagetes erecta TaxID=13708 RepID=A0AAD8KJ93_TARER|nr:hypothetical protein QVD17_19321 [Tagetes erecta]